MGTDTLHSNIKKLGVNGFGRIGKLTLWHHVGRKYFDEIIVNIGRQPGSSSKILPITLNGIQLTDGCTAIFTVIEPNR